MSPLVVDASAVFSALTRDDGSGRWAREVIRGAGLTAPQVMPAEVANTLRRRDGVPDAGSVLTDLLRLPVDLVPFAPVAPRVWELREKLSSYDAWYVAVAEELGVPLVTLDRRLARAPGPRCTFLLPPG